MFSCTACKPSNPATSTVKVDPARLAADKENVAQNMQQKQAEEKEQQRVREREIQERKAEEERRREAERREMEHRQREQERLEREQREAEEELERRREAERVRIAAEAEKRRQDQERMQREELERQEQERRREEQAKADAEMLNTFLTSKGYGEDVNSKRKTMRKYYYPLHDAVNAKDADAVRVLLAAGADPTLKSSSGKTALDRAKKSNTDGSLATIVERLSAAMPEEN
mmetsp:Transcript_68035/g.127055  ORF Transcript_68035/g.127055 Transcript_68035/m.127055 type:complete len:230 (+) Transcript_68035:87-776(+)